MNSFASRIAQLEEELYPQSSEGELSLSVSRPGGSRLDVLKGMREDLDNQFEERNRQLESVWSAKVGTKSEQRGVHRHQMY